MIQLNYNPLLEWMAQRIKKNKNCFVAINGQTGSGKTYGAIDLSLKLSQKLGTPFTIDGNLDFSFGGLLKKMNLPENRKAGTCFVFEEIGSVDSGGASRQWQTKANMFFNSFMQTARSRNQILFFTTPMFSALEKASRQLVHLQISMTGINHKDKKSYGKPFILQANTITGKVYFKYLRFEYQGNRTKLQQLTFDLPPPDVVTIYEDIKEKFLSKLNKKMIDSEQEQENPATERPKIDTEQLLKDKARGLSLSELAKKYDYSVSSVKQKLARAKKEGKISKITMENEVLKQTNEKAQPLSSRYKEPLECDAQ